MSHPSQSTDSHDRRLAIAQGEVLQAQTQRLQRKLTLRILLVVAGSLIIVLAWGLAVAAIIGSGINEPHSITALRRLPAQPANGFMVGKRVTEQISSSTKLRADSKPLERRRNTTSHFCNGAVFQNSKTR